MDSIPRNDSLENLVGNLWKIGRTPSEAEFQMLSGAGLETESPMAGGNPLGAQLGMHRVASIDILRKMLLNQHTALTQAQAAATVTAAAEVLGAPAGQAGLVAPIPAPVAGAALSAGAAGPAFSLPPATNLPDWGKVLAGSRAAEGSAGTSSGGARGQKRKESARVKSKAASKKAKSPPLSDDDDMSEGSGEEGHNFKNLSVEEQRRQRRMLSNRESARRSRRRKLEHVHIITGQLDIMRAEMAAVAKQAADVNARNDVLARENVTLKAEVDRLNAQIRDLAAGGGIPRVGSLQRIPSSDHLVKRLRGEDCDVGESPRGFVPFRSLRSYENLLSLQQQQAQANPITTS